MMPKYRVWDTETKKICEVVALDLHNSEVSYSTKENEYGKVIKEFIKTEKMADVELMQSIGINLWGRELYNGWFSINLFLPFAIAIQYYTIDQLIDAYKKKMKRNHERQDGTADAGKGYV